MTFALPDRHTLARYAGVALLACGNIATIYGAWQLRGSFGLRFGNSLLDALPPFLLLCLPMVAICALFEFRGFRLSRLVGLPVKAGESPWLSAAGFGVLGLGWLFLKGGWADREATKAEAALAKPSTVHPPHNPGPGREAMETVVFVVVLVLMLKLFVVEAFVIPTGSMAETLYGYKKIVTCPECGFEFPVNASREAEPSGGAATQETTGYCCPNCRYENSTGAKDKKFEWSSGDRVLVGKFLSVDHRGHVVVFKFPDEPQTKQTAQNYIKRLVGLPGETVAIHNGDLYVTRALTYPADAKDDTGAVLYPRPKDKHDEWRAPLTDYVLVTETDARGNRTTVRKPRVRWDVDDYRYPNKAEAVALFEASQKAGFTLGDKGFEIVRKPDDQVMSMRRIVYDNDHPSVNLAKSGAIPRWQPLATADAGWKTNGPTGFAHTGAEFGWVGYQHLIPKGGGWSGTAANAVLSAEKITNFMGYNAGFENDPERGIAQHNLENSNNWVGDLMLESTVTVTDGGAVVLELSKGEHRYRAELDKGQVRLKMFPGLEEYTREDGNKSIRPRVVPVGDDPFTLVSKESGVKAGTAHRLRFANVDCRLRVWVDDKPIDFGGKADYPPQPIEEPSEADMKRPACVGATGTAVVQGLKLWRDTHYINYPGGKLNTFYVQPGHYLCMGDNSSQSSDGRMWGLVPERLMLGRAVFIFFPFDRVGFIR